MPTLSRPANKASKAAAGAESARVAVLADTHTSLDLARQALRQIGPVDAVIHLGDYYADAMRLAAELAVPMHAVKGDNDFEEGLYERVVELSGRRLFLTHGHFFEGPEALDELAAEARSRDCAAALFGHTHAPIVERRDGVLLVNPGALYFAEAKKTFALLQIRPGSMTAEIFSLDEKSLPTLSFTETRA